MRIHLWCQSFEVNPGGVQAFTRFVVQALCELYPEADIVVLARNDEEKRAGPVVGSPWSVVGFGRWPSAMRSVAFALSALRHVRSDQPELIISTHVNFAPVAKARRFSTSRASWRSGTGSRYGKFKSGPCENRFDWPIRSLP